MMICVVVNGPTIEAAVTQIQQALLVADLVELRLDSFVDRELASLRELRKIFSIPMIFTLRSPLEGGKTTISEEARLEEIRKIAILEPEYLDLEKSIPKPFIQEIQSNHPCIKLILSFHQFSNTQQQFDELYALMKEVPADFYKIALLADHCLEALRFLNWGTRQEKKPICISMGSEGQLSRILAPILGNGLTYAYNTGERAAASGQLSVEALLGKYRYKSLTPNTSIYGLIGDPIDRSLSDETHNAFIQKWGIDAVYLKMKLSQDHLPEFLHLSKGIFKGMSVTMPLKEAVIPLLDEIASEAQEIGAVNTLLFKNGKIYGYNTDGVGALNALEQRSSVIGKQIVILGGGGAAKAIAFEAIKRGGKVTVYCRNPEKEKQIRGVLKNWEEIDELERAEYDILINATPLSMPIECTQIQPNKIIMDLTIRPKDTDLLKWAVEKKCQVVYGYEMFIEQAIYQFEIWFGELFDPGECRLFLYEKANLMIKEPI